MAVTTINGVAVEFPDEIIESIVRNIRATFLLVPAAHLTIFRRITIYTPQGTPPYAGGGSGLGYPRLSIYCFDPGYRPQNRVQNLTLLHEIGHLVDHHYGCLDAMQRDAPSDYAALRLEIHIAPSRRTHGPSELYADAYQKVLNRRGVSRRVREAVLASVAFAGITL